MCVQCEGGCRLLGRFIRHLIDRLFKVWIQITEIPSLSMWCLHTKDWHSHCPVQISWSMHIMLNSDCKLHLVNPESDPSLSARPLSGRLRNRRWACLVVGVHHDEIYPNEFFVVKVHLKCNLCSIRRSTFIQFVQMPHASYGLLGFSLMTRALRLYGIP